MICKFLFNLFCYSFCTKSLNVGTQCSGLCQGRMITGGNQQHYLGVFITHKKHIKIKEPLIEKCTSIFRRTSQLKGLLEIGSWDEYGYRTTSIEFMEVMSSTNIVSSHNRALSDTVPYFNEYPEIFPII